MTISDSDRLRMLTPRPGPVRAVLDTDTYNEIDDQFARLAQMCGHPEWISDERFASNGSRVANRGAIVELISDCIRKKPAAEWLEQLERAGIPAGPINTITRALSDVQAQHRGVVRTIAGMPLVGAPVRLDGGRADSDLPPPKLGEHTDEVLASLGLKPSGMDRLKSEGVVG